MGHTYERIAAVLNRITVAIPLLCLGFFLFDSFKSSQTLSFQTFAVLALFSEELGKLSKFLPLKTHHIVPFRGV